MNRLTLVSAILLISFEGQALAANCTPSQTNIRLTSAQILNLLSPGSSTTPTSSTVFACGSSSTEKWNEYLVGHITAGPNTNGVVWDYKLGTGSATEPPEQVATYTVTSGTGLTANTITYNYGTGGTFTYRIFGPAGVPFPGQYSFCNPTGPAYDITVSNDPKACGFPP